MEILTKVKLVAGEGMYLTKKNRDENQEPMMLKVADLNSAENPYDWIEITMEEGDRIVAEWQAEQEKKMREENERMQQEMNNATR